MVNRLGMFFVVKHHTEKVAITGDHISILESHFSKLATMDSEDAEPMNVEILISTLSNEQQLATMIVSVHTMSEDEAIWDHNTMLLILVYGKVSQNT